MKTKVLYFTGLLILAAVTLDAAAEIRWLEKDYDFGTWKEITGPKTGTSRFVNLGPDTIAITNVKPSCGCTSADYPRTPLAPGDTAVISYTYDSEMRPGKFDKTVRVTLSDGSKPVIRIIGNVIGTPESLATLYPVEAGEIMRLSDSIVSFGETSFGRSPIAFVNAYVLSQDTITPTLSSDSPALTITPSASKAGPGDIVTFSLKLDTHKLGQFGPVEVPYEYGKMIGVIVPDPDQLKIAQQGKNPYINVKPNMIDMGECEPGTTVNREFTIANTGKAPLEIFRIYAGSEAVRTTGKTALKIKPGKSEKIEIAADAGRLSAGVNRIPLTIISNDPLSPKKEIWIILKTTPNTKDSK